MFLFNSKFEIANKIRVLGSYWSLAVKIKPLRDPTCDVQGRKYRIWLGGGGGAVQK